MISAKQSRNSFVASFTVCTGAFVEQQSGKKICDFGMTVEYLHIVGLPAADALLHGARLRYAITLGRSAPSELWTLLGAEQRWLQSLAESIEWFKQQVQGFGPDKFGNHILFDFNHSFKCGGKTFANWIRKAVRHSTLQHKIKTHWQEWHHKFLQQCAIFGLQVQFPWTTTPISQKPDGGEACIQCGKYFNSRAAWAVHAFKVHQRTHPCRDILGAATRCEACGREYRTSRRLLHHLQYKQTCAEKLKMQGLFYPVGPGRNSRAEQQDMSRLPIPVMASHGPERDWRPEIDEMVQLSLRNPEQVDPILAEDILNLFEAFRSDESVEEQVDRFKAVLQTSTQDFTLIKRTAIDVMTQIEQEPEAFRLAISQATAGLCVGRYSIQVEDQLVCRRFAVGTTVFPAGTTRECVEVLSGTGTFTTVAITGVFAPILQHSAGFCTPLFRNEEARGFTVLFGNYRNPGFVHTCGIVS